MPTRIVDVGDKAVVPRSATAEGRLHLAPASLAAVRTGRIDKGDVATVVAVAALQAVKRTPEWLPLCHPLPVTGAEPHLSVEDDHLRLQVTVRTTAQTGVEMEALCGVAAGLLCAWDMVKPLEKDAHGQYPTARIDGLRVVHKEKGSS